MLWHTRYDSDGNQTLVRECRSCANQRYRIKRSAIRRNRELEKEALASMESYAESYFPPQEADSLQPR